MCMADCCGEFINFRRRGFNMIVPDFLGYGMSGGKPSEQGVYATADAASISSCTQQRHRREKDHPLRLVPRLGGRR